MQRSPHASLRPKKSEVPRCAQCSPINPIRPLLSLNATNSSLKILTRTGGQSGAGISSDNSAGIQKSPMRLHIQVHALLPVINSLSSLESIDAPYQVAERFKASSRFKFSTLRYRA